MQDMFREMETTWMILRAAGYEGSDAARNIFDMAVGVSLKNSRIWDRLPEWTKWWEQGWPMKGDPAHLFVLAPSDMRLMKKDPYSQLVRFTDRSQVAFTPVFH
jgi:cytosine/adenosine deaminase-related metal-dependent hydrolase